MAREGKRCPEPAGASAPGRDRRSGCGLRLYFEALQGSSLLLALKSYFRPQPKSATANYTANNGEGARSARLGTPGLQRQSRLFARAEPGQPPRDTGTPVRRRRPRPKPRGLGWRGQHGRSGGRARRPTRAALGGIPSRPGTARRALPGGGWWSAGRRGHPAPGSGRRAGT